MKARLKDGTLLVETARADLRPGGRVEGEGRFDLAAGDGTWTLRAARLPDGLLAALRRRGDARPLGHRRKRARRHRDGPARAGRPAPAHGRRRPRRSPAPGRRSRTATAPPRVPRRHDARPRGDVPPRSPGERRAEGSLRAPTLAGLASGRLVDGRLRVRSPTSPPRYAELRALFPSLVVAAPEGVDLGGAFRLDVRGRGTSARAAGGRRRRRSTRHGAARSRSARPPTPAAARSKGRPRPPAYPIGTVRPGATGTRVGRRPLLPRPEAGGTSASTLDATGLCLAEELPLARDAPRHARGRGAGAADRRARRDRRRSGPGSGPGRARLEASGRLSLSEPASATPTSTPSSPRGALGRGARPPARRRPRRSTSRARAGRASRRPSPRASRSARCASVPAARRAPPARPPRGTARADARRAGLRLLRSRGVSSRRGRHVVPLSGDLRVFATIPLADPLGGTATVELEGVSAGDARRPARRLRPGARSRSRAAGSLSNRSPSTGSGRRSSSPPRPTSCPAHARARPSPTSSRTSPSRPAAGPTRRSSPLSSPGARPRARSLSTPTRRVRPTRSRGASSSTARARASRGPLAWPTEIRDPLLEADLTPGTASLTRGEALLNGGPLLLSGGWYRGGGTTLTALFADVRYRLAYGLAAILSGELTFDVDRGRAEDLRDRHARPRAPREGHRPRPRDPRARPRSSRGDRHRELLPRHARARRRHRDRLGGEDPQQRRRPVRLLEPARGHGHRPAAGRPRPDRRREERPRLRLRPDLPRRQGASSPTPGTPPPIRASTSSRPPRSRTTCRSRSAASGDVFESTRESFQQGGTGGRGEADAAARLAWGLAGYYSARLASTLGQALGQVAVSARPVFVLGETDPTARLTLSREFSRNVTLAASFDLKNAQRQTWVVDVHRLRRLPPVGLPDLHRRRRELGRHAAAAHRARGDARKQATTPTRRSSARYGPRLRTASPGAASSRRSASRAARP